MNNISHTNYPIGQHVVNHHAMLIPEAFLIIIINMYFN